MVSPAAAVIQSRAQIHNETGIYKELHGAAWSGSERWPVLCGKICRLFEKAQSFNSFWSFHVLNVKDKKSESNSLFLVRVGIKIQVAIWHGKACIYVASRYAT